MAFCEDLQVFDTNFDKQKLQYHVAAVSRWLEKGLTRGPIYTEMELSTRCNCRCIFCGVDYLVNTSDDAISAEAARRILTELHGMGNKAVMFSGHGESLLNPAAGEIIGFASGLMSTSVTTNGLSLDEANLPLIDGLEWIRFSINGCDAANYAEVHGVAPEMFDRVMGNVAAAVERKRKLHLGVTIGSQLVLLNENAAGVPKLARALKDIGVNYFSVKPYSRHPLCKHHLDVDYGAFAGLDRELAALEDDSFKVIYRAASMTKAGRPKPYGKCYGTHFLCFVSANGDVWECNVFAGDPRFLIGNAIREHLPDIWSGPRRRQVLEFIEREMKIDECRDICRMDECNRYLWRLKHPWPHDNFV